MSRRTVGVFAISVVAEMVDVQAQNLRVYERAGLVTPERTAGGTRRYSQADVDRLLRVRSLLDEGLNLAGVARVLALEDHLERLQDENARLVAENTRLRDGSGPGQS